MILLVGLGNPGPRYEATRHNIGFVVAGEVASGGVSWSERFRGQFGLLRVGEERVGVLRPQTYMNRSGESVRAACEFYKISRPDVLVIHDELDVPFGDVRLKLGGGEAGHNGLRSVSQHLGGKDYHRLRIGIGRPPPDFSGGVADFVLQAFAPAEAGLLEDIRHRGAKAAEQFISLGSQAAMNEVNRRT